MMEQFSPTCTDTANHCHAAGASTSTGQEVHEVLELLWAGALQPLVMGLAGASVRFDALPSHLAARALALAAIGKPQHM